MSPRQARLVWVGLAKQSAKGSIAAQPAFAVGVTDGKPVTWEMDQDPIEVTSEKPTWADADRTSIVPGAEFTSLAHPKTLGLQLLGVLGAIVTTGAVDPFQHVITPALDVPYLTFFGRAFDGDYMRVADCKVDELTIKWEGAGKIEVEMTLMGLDLNPWQTTAFTPTNDESLPGTTLFRSNGGTFKVDAASGVPVTARISAGEIRIARGAEGVPQSASPLPADIATAVVELETSLTIVPDDLTEIRKIFTGSAAGTTPSKVPVYGSFEHFWTISANHDLKIEAPRTAFVAEMPDADPSGGAVEIELEGVMYQPTSGDAIKATLRNAHSAY